MEHRVNIIGPAQWPALVPEDTWRGVRALLTDEGRRTTTGNALRWLGGGHLYRCGTCGGPMRSSTSGISHSRGGRAYRCTDSAHVVRSAKALDGFVVELLIGRLALPDAADLGQAASEDLALVHAERLAVQARLDQLVDTFSAGSINIRGLQRGTADMTAQTEALDQRLATAASDSAVRGVTGPGAATRWAALDLSRQRAILDALVVVTVHPARKGRPPGWRPGAPYFDPNTVEVTWR